MAEIKIVVSGPVGCGKSAVLGEIEILMRALGVPVRYEDEKAAQCEKNMTHADWADALEMYQPSVVLVEAAQQQAEPGADAFVLEFERWNAETGALPRGGSWMAEVSDIIQRAAQSAQLAGEPPAYYVRQVHEGHLPEFNTVDEFSDGLGGGDALYRKPQCGQRAGEPQNDPWCPRCKGHGEETAMSNNGPDAEELTIACQHCGGEGSLAEAYEGVVKLLEAEQKKYLEACGKLWFERHGDAGQRAGVAEGWKLVPIHPTPAMKDAGAAVNAQGMDFAHHTWAVMLAAAPTQQEGDHA
jgi:hypothetical protein